jgi:hypothetical protein
MVITVSRVFSLPFTPAGRNPISHLYFKFHYASNIQVPSVMIIHDSVT